MIGYQRFTIWSLHRLISLRTYHGTVSYQRINVNVMPTTATSSSTPQPLHLQQQQQQHYHQHQQNQQRNANFSAAFPTAMHSPTAGLTSTGGVGPSGFRPTLMKHSMSCGNQLDCVECNGDGDCDACDTGFGDVLTLETQQGHPSPGYYRPRLDSWYSATSRKSAYFSTADSMYQSVAEKLSNGDAGGLDFPDSKVPAQMYGPASRLPALTAPVPDSWTVERGEFVMVHASYQTHIGSDCHFAPLSQLNDGIIWLCVIRGGATRPELLKFLLGMSNGTHLAQQNRFIEMIPVTAFRIEPDTEPTLSSTQTAMSQSSSSSSPSVAAAEKQHGHFTVDGERVEYGPIQAEIVPGLAQVMAPIYCTT